METQTLITFGARNYRYGAREVRQTVVHELAHHWYGDTVTPDDWSDVWMNEGMAMYLEAQYSAAQGWKSWPSWVRTFDANDALWREIYGPPGDYDRRRVRAGQRLLLRGPDAGSGCATGSAPATFDDLLRRWPQEHRDTVQDRAVLRRLAGRHVGQDPAGARRPFFDEWLLSPTSPS